MIIVMIIRNLLRYNYSPIDLELGNCSDITKLTGKPAMLNFSEKALGEALVVS